MQDKIFDNDQSKHRYNVIIEVYENCVCTKVVKFHKGKTNMSYYELVGILESQKQHVIWTQRESNMKKLKKQTSK